MLDITTFFIDISSSSKWIDVYYQLWRETPLYRVKVKSKSYLLLSNKERSMLCVE